MQKNSYLVFTTLLILALVASACGGAPATQKNTSEETVLTELAEEVATNTSTTNDITRVEENTLPSSSQPIETQSPIPPEEPPPELSEEPPNIATIEVLSGYLDIGYGDPPEDSGLPGLIVASLTYNNQLIAILEIEPNLALQFQGRLVEVTGEFFLPEGQKEQRFRVDEIKEVEVPQIKSSGTGRELLTGSQPWVNVLCRFNSDPFEPHDTAWYQNLFSNSYPGLDHYWRQISNNNIDLLGSVTTAWYEMPEPRNGYINGDGDARLTKLATDCAEAADDDVYFPNFVGINFIFNDSLDCCAWGGSASLTFDGMTKNYRTTWLPPWAQAHKVIAHEMGHGFTFPHSTGPHDNPPSGLGVYVSRWDVMSRSGGTCMANDFTNFGGCFGQGTIAYHLSIDGWIPTGRQANIPDGSLQTFTIGQLYPLQVDGSMLLVTTPINNSTTNFYTVELRRLASLGEDIYDQNIPDTAVIIHEVDTNRSSQDGRGMVVDEVADGNDDVNDAGARWVQGETYVDTTNNIFIAVHELDLQNPAAITAEICIVNNSAETTPPISAATPTGTPGNADWWLSPVSVDLSATDDCTNVKTIFYQIDGGSIQSVPGSDGSFFVTADGMHNIGYWAVDFAGNIETADSLTLNIDTTAPVVNISTDQLQYTRSELITFSLSAIEVGPPLGSGLASLSAELTTPQGTIPISDGTVIDPFAFDLGVYNFTAEAEDIAGNVGTVSGSFELIATLESLLPTLQRLCDNGEISKPGICNALTAKLNAAIASNDRGNINAMINQLNAFLNQLEAQNGKSVSQTAFDILQQDVNSVIEQFSG